MAQLDPSPQDGHRPGERKAKGSQQVAGARREGEKMPVKEQSQRPMLVTPPRGFAEKGWAQDRSVEVGRVHSTIREQEKPVVQEGGCRAVRRRMLRMSRGEDTGKPARDGGLGTAGGRQIGGSGGIT